MSQSRDIALQVAENRLMKSMVRASQKRRDGIALKILGLMVVRKGKR